MQEFQDAAFAHAWLDWQKYVRINPRDYHPADADLLIGNYSKAEKQLGWHRKPGSWTSQS